MDTITINRSKPTTVEFNMRVDGAAVDEAGARFVIHAEGYDVSINCTRVSQDVFAAEVPALSFMSKGVYDCSIEVVINNQIFKPLKGNVTVVDDVKVDVSTKPFTDQPKQKEPKQQIAGEEGREQEEEDVVNRVAEPVTRPETPLSAFNITKFLQMRNAAEEEEVTENEKDKKVRQIIESMNIVVKPAKKKPSLKALTESKRAKAKLTK